MGDFCVAEVKNEVLPKTTSFHNLELEEVLKQVLHLKRPQGLNMRRMEYWDPFPLVQVQLPPHHKKILANLPHVTAIALLYWAVRVWEKLPL